MVDFILELGKLLKKYNVNEEEIVIGIVKDKEMVEMVYRKIVKIYINEEGVQFIEKTTELFEKPTDYDLYDYDD